MGWLFALFAAFALASRTDESTMTGETNEHPTGTGPDGYRIVSAQVDELARLMRWNAKTTQWAKRMFSAQAFSESRGNTNAKNTTSGERAAAQRIYERLRQKDPQLTDQAPPNDWFGVYGSGGLYGLIPATYASTFSASVDDDRAQIHPDDVFDPWRSSVAYLKYLQGLMRWKEFTSLPASERNAYALKRGGAAPTLMDDPNAGRSIKSHENLDKATRAFGFPKEWASEPIPSEFYKRPPSYWDLLVNGEEDQN